MKLKNGALFIADAHYQKGVREEFLKLLKDPATDKIKTDQIFFMVDIFDLLVGEISYTINQNRELIDLINQISIKTEVIYLEGNHDFNLQKLFPKVKVINYQEQPLVLKDSNQTILLAHGDRYISTNYNLYVKIIRDHLVLNTLNIIDILTNKLISKTILKKQKNKKICKKIENFSKIAKQKSKIYDISGNRCKLLCEGHYHIDYLHEQEMFSYRVLNSFACGGVYYILDLDKGVVFNQITLRRGSNG